MKTLSNTKSPPVGCICGLVVSLAIACFFVVHTVKEIRDSRREQQQYRETTAQIRRLIDAHGAFSNLQSEYERCLPNGKTFLDATSLERERSVEKLAEAITGQPILFLGRVDDVRRDGGQYILQLDHADLFSPFHAVLVCSQQLADKVLLERDDYMDTFAVVAKISRIEQKPPTEESKIRFVLYGECEDVLHCGRYWPEEGEF